tara:strand:+ start:467 stop:1576 length:1110 start_codon:yes stop_codon:yes gene_type:complete
MSSAWDNGVWGHGDWGQQANATVTVTGVTLSSTRGSVSVEATIGSGWGRDAWSSMAWGVAHTVELNSLQSTFTAGTLTIVADALVQASGVSFSSAIGQATGEPENVYDLTGVSSSTALGSVSIEEGIGIVAPSVTMSFATGDETGSGTVDAGWGRGNYGSFAWNENIEFITAVSGVTMTSSLGTTTQSVGTGVIASPTGVSMTSAPGTLVVSEATALINPTAVTMNFVTGTEVAEADANVTLVGPSDQLDFNIGSLTIDIFTQVDPTSLVSTFTAGSLSITGDAPNVQVTGNVVASTLGSVTIGVGTGVTATVTGLGMNFASGTEAATGGAVVDVSGIGLSVVSGNPFATPWSTVLTNKTNTWTEVDAA